MKNAIRLGLGFLIVLGMTGCTEGKSRSEGPEDAYHKISPEDAKKMMDEGGVTVVDVRTPEEYEEGHISGAINVVNEEIGESRPEQLSDQEAVLLIYCRSGRRSKAAAGKLAAQGYQHIYDFGGIQDWPYETVKGE